MSSVLITGTSKGIGLATAVAVARAGHKVYATMRQPRRSPQLAEIATEEKLPIVISAMDVDSDYSVAATLGALQREHGPLDVLVNNAGIARTGSIEELEFSGFRAVMETNFFGPLRCIKAVLPQMRAANNGCIINLSSVSGRIASSPFGAYAASKFALEALSETLAQEVKTVNIRVVIVEPGIVDTSMPRAFSEQTHFSVYPHSRRMADLFAASLRNSTNPTQVAEKILAVIESDSGRLRHPMGHDAEPFLRWRRSLTDDQWVAWGAADDDTWYDNVKRTFGVDARRGE